MRIFKTYTLLRTIKAAKSSKGRVKKAGLFYTAYKMFRKL